MQTGTKTVRTFITRIRSRACENFGAVDYTITDVLSVVPGGLRVDTITRGISDGERFETQHATATHQNVTIEAAAKYRLANGYTDRGARRDRLEHEARSLASQLHGACATEVC